MDGARGDFRDHAMLGGKEKKAAKPVVLGPYRFTHAQLEKEGIIVESNVPDNRCVPCFF